MSTLFVTLLTLHVLTGLVGVCASYVTTLSLLKSSVVQKRLRFSSWFAWVNYMISWFTGGYYYWFYYGSNVKPLIKGGDYAWAHSIVMEAKEHIFLLLPVLSLVVAAIVHTSSDRLENDSTFKSSVVYLSAITTALAVVIALSGILITGGAR